MNSNLCSDEAPNSDDSLRPSKVLLCQSAGFLAIIMVCLFDELLGLSSLVLGDNSCIVDMREFTIKTLLILAVWLLVSGSTRRILARANRLAKFMKVCAWCRRIEYQGRWMGLEKFLKLGFDNSTSHGICEECLRKAQADFNQSKQKQAATEFPGSASNCPVQA